MKQLRYCLPLAIAAALLVVPARSCGPDFPETIFVLPNGPGGSYALFAAGRLGVPQPGYRTRNLVVAYNYLTHRPLSDDEQQQAVDTDQYFTENLDLNDPPAHSDTPGGFALWIAARKALGPVDKYTPDDKLDIDLYANYDAIPNCLDDAFTTAAHTLAARQTAYGKQDPAVIEWVRGQDAVFSNCGDGKPQQYYGPGQPPPPPPAPHPPAALPANAPLWLQQDRHYQLAAASFYATHYDDAISQFRAIAADTTSPWSPIARYLVARAFIRKATLGDTPPTSPDADADAAKQAAQQAAAKAASQKNLALAQHELLALQSDPHMAPMRNAVNNLLDYVDLRLEPDAQAIVLANRLHGPDSGRFEQSLIDLTYLRTNPSDPTVPPAPNSPAPSSNDMLAWIEDINTLDQTPNRYSGVPSPYKDADVARATDDILHHWRDTHATPWLLAALMSAKPTDAVTPDLIHAAKAIPKDDAGYVALTYHRLRLGPNDLATRPTLLAILPAIQHDQTLSTINLFTSLDATSTPTLEAWLATAGRVPAGDTSYDSLNDNDPSTPAKPAEDSSTPPSTEDVCGTKVPANTTKLFDLDAANALNRNLTLRLLATAAESSALPANLQFQIAQATWARAVLLDQPAIAHRMTPILIQCRAAWNPVLAAYDASTTPDDRHANGLLALMRFASTEPSVRYGEERRNGFASYDELRQNWWCTTVPAPGYDVDYQPDLPKTPKADAPPPPIFLTPADLTEAQREVAALEKIPNASTYMAQQALAWMKLHPKDPRTPDLLGQADRVVRNSCRNDPPYDAQGKQTADSHNMTYTANLAHALFDALHQNYPQSPWTKRYKSWQ